MGKIKFSDKLTCLGRDDVRNCICLGVTLTPLSFLVIYAVELGMNSHFRGGTGFVRPNLFFDEPFCLGTYRMV